MRRDFACRGQSAVGVQSFPSPTAPRRLARRQSVLLCEIRVLGPLFIDKTWFLLIRLSPPTPLSCLHEWKQIESHTPPCLPAGLGGEWCFQSSSGFRAFHLRTSGTSVAISPILSRRPTSTWLHFKGFQASSKRFKGLQSKKTYLAWSCPGCPGPPGLVHFIGGWPGGEKRDRLCVPPQCSRWI